MTTEQTGLFLTMLSFLRAQRPRSLSILNHFWQTCPFERALLEAEDSRRTSETCHSDLGLQHQMTAIAHFLQATDADFGSTLLPHMLGLEGWSEEAGDYKAKVELWPAGSLQPPPRSCWMRCLSAWLFCLYLVGKGTEAGREVSRSPEGRPLGLCGIVLPPHTSPAPLSFCPFLCPFCHSQFLSPLSLSSYL